MRLKELNARLRINCYVAQLQKNSTAPKVNYCDAVINSISKLCDTFFYNGY